MDQELAKKLKDAGFPQKYHWKSPGVLDHYITEEYLKDPVKNSPIEIPTLSELIAACGDNFKILENMTGGRWDAESIEIMDIKVGYKGTGSTAEEAVAKLWLELKKSA